MAANSETTFPPAERQREAEELIADAQDDAQRIKRTAALRPLLRRYRNAPAD